MPVMDGITAIKTIRQDHDESLLPILVLSAVGEKETCVASFDVGANDFILKPFHKNELLARISVHLQVAQLTRELASKNRRLMEEKTLARRVQLGLLPRGPVCDDLEIESFYRPSDQIGGDFFDTCSNGDGVQSSSETYPATEPLGPHHGGLPAGACFASSRRRWILRWRSFPKLTPGSAR